MTSDRPTRRLRLTRGMRAASNSSTSPDQRDSRNPSKDRKSNVEDKPGDRESQKPKPDPRDDRFYHVWDKFTKRQPLPARSRVVNLDEDISGKHKKATRNRDGLASRENAANSFEEAAESCRKKVRAIVAECKRLNKKYHDPLFDLRSRHSLVSLTGWVNDDAHFIGANGRMDAVADVKRVRDVFENPQFYVDGATANDVRQSMYAGNCWFLASVTALLGMPESIERLCVERNEQVGVYGFCFHRDGEWISSVVDDRLCVRFHEDQRHCLLSTNPDSTESRSALPEKFLKTLPKGPDALYFASCKSDDETWLPLLEKAYAKAHLSYQATEGGWTGEGIEDLTGGVNSTINAEDILDKDAFWEELQHVNKDFLFGCGSKLALYADQEFYETKGVVTQHAYTVLGARTVTVKDKSKGKDGKPKNEEKTVRLLKVRNPWGETEWSGAWADGSKEWTPETMRELDHTFGDDGIFWITLDDFMKAYPLIDRTRLFGPEWTVAQQWTTVSVPRSVSYFDTNYLPTTFTLHITKPGPVCVLLSQPDDRYFEALSGRYSFELHFRIYKEGEKDVYLIRSMSSTASGRSVCAELDCEPGSYTVKMKLTPYRYDGAKTAAEIIKDFEKYDIEKVMAVGKMFDLAHSRGRLREMEIAETKKMRRDGRDKRHVEMRAIRDLQKARRRRGKLADQRIKRKEREKKAARKKAKQQRAETAEAAQKRADDSGKTDGNQAEVEAESAKPQKAGTAVTETVPSSNDVMSGQEAKASKSQVAQVSLAVRDEKNELMSPSDSAIEVTAGDTAASPADAEVIVKEAETGTSIANGKAVVIAIRSKEDQNADNKAEEAKSDSQDLTPQGQAAEGNEGQADDDDDDWTSNISDFGSVQAEDFAWNSEIDGSVDEEDFDVNSEDDDDDLFDENDWFALATIGLRLYSKDPDASIKVEYVEQEEEPLSRAPTM